MLEDKPRLMPIIDIPANVDQGNSLDPRQILTRLHAVSVVAIPVELLEWPDFPRFSAFRLDRKSQI
jgi:hypothetical protein